MGGLLTKALVAAALATGIAITAPAAQANQLVGLTIPATDVANSWYAYDGPPRANVLLPDGYDPNKAYPLLLLLHGLTDNYGTWARPDKATSSTPRPASTRSS